MSELFQLLNLDTPANLISLLTEKGIPKYPAYPPMVDFDAKGWWECSTLGLDHTICVWHKGKRVTFQFESGTLKSIEVPATVTVKI
jgi:hypothetical protein